MFPLVPAASFLRAALPYLIVTGAVVGVLAVTYNMGKSSVQKDWDIEKSNTKLEIARLQGVIDSKEGDHQEASREVATHLSTEKEIYEKARSDAARATADRLRKSEERADLYKRHSEGDAIERERLASHAAQLDRSLEEGRGVVTELKDLVGLRDKQLILLGQQIKTDRKLFDEPSK